MTTLAKHQNHFVLGVIASASLSKIVNQILVDREDIQLISTLPSRPILSNDATQIPDLLLVETTDDILPEQITNSYRREGREPFPVVAITSHPDHRAAVKLIRNGVLDYFALPTEQHRLYSFVDKFIQDKKAQQDQLNFLDNKAKTFDFSNIIGRSPALTEILSVVQKIVDNEHITVLVLGETGTGKGLLAKAIHYNSRNRTEPFVEIGCSALPESLLESELFGHEKGAFTDAREKKVGLFELAGQGTIFLDEIGDITPGVQSKLLKVLEERTMRRVGGVHSIKVQARIVAATSRNLDDLVTRGLFRKDLYYRLHTVPLTMPPLRDRREDISLLVSHFLRHYGELSGKPEMRISEEAVNLLRNNSWEGNVRELMHWIERAVVLSEDDEIGIEDFAFSAARPELKQFASQEQNSIETDPDTGGGFTLNLPFDQATFVETEKKLVREVLARVEGNKSRAAAILKISRPRLERIIRQDPGFFKSAKSKP
jgi:two-component system response regulator AtoC